MRRFTLDGSPYAGKKPKQIEATFKNWDKARCSGCGDEIILGLRAVRLEAGLFALGVTRPLLINSKIMWFHADCPITIPAAYQPPYGAKSPKTMPQ